MTFEPYAARYADDGDAERLAALAVARLSARMRRSGVACAACGEQFVSDRSDAKTCSAKCRKRLSRKHD